MYDPLVDELIDDNSQSKAEPNDTPVLRQGALLRDIITTFDRRLYRYIAQRIAPDDVQDVLQEVYGRLHRIIQATPEVILNGAYIYKAADSAIRDQKRRWRVRAHDQHVELSDHIPHTMPSQHDELQGRQNIERLKAALAEIPKIQRRIILMHRLDGMSLPEISRELDVPLRSVERYLSQALVTLKARMEVGQ